MTIAPAITNEAPYLLHERDAGVATLRLNRPEKYNPLSRAMLNELQSALDEIAEDDSVRVVVIAANGPAFCAGHDLKEMRAHTDREFHDNLFAQCSRMMLSINRLPQPVIAQVDGIATAAGCQLVAACDLAMATQRSRFAVSGINVGLFCSTPAVALSRNLSRKQALAMLLTGDFIDAATALTYGLINAAVPADELENTVRQYAESICAKSSLAIAIGKKLFYRQLELRLEDAYALAGGTMACNMDSTDAREGIDAFLAKRQPQWQGR